MVQEDLPPGNEEQATLTVIRRTANGRTRDLVSTATVGGSDAGHNGGSVRGLGRE